MGGKKEREGGREGEREGGREGGRGREREGEGEGGRGRERANQAGVKERCLWFEAKKKKDKREEWKNN